MSGPYEMERIPFQFTLVSSEWITLRRQLIASVGWQWFEWKLRQETSHGLTGICMEMVHLIRVWVLGLVLRFKIPSSRSFQPETVEAMTVRYQAEDGLLVGGVASASLSPGFTGSGYLLYSKANGDDVYSEHEVYIPSDDNYLVNLHYTCPTACELTLIAFDLDGTEISRSQAKFQPSGGWSHWKTRTVDLSFRAGEFVRLRLVAGDQPGPALDQIHISR